jgi:polyisoprenoid-binding protein YceI
LSVARWLVLSALYALNIAIAAQKVEPKTEPKTSDAHAPVRQQIAFGKQTQVGFSVSIFGLFTKKGSFQDVDGVLTLEGDQARVSATIKAASATMKSQADAELLKSTPYFDAKNHPDIVFRSELFEAQRLLIGGALPGQLSLRGVTRTQLFSVQPQACNGQQPKPVWGCGFIVSGALQRSDYGMHARKGIVGDEVKLVLSISPLHQTKSPQQ